MTGFNHALTGAAIGLAIQQPLLVVPFALASHFLLDILPHFGGHPIYEWEHKHFFKVIGFDAILCSLGIGFALWLAPHAALAILLGVVFAMLPDLTLIHYYTHGKPKHWFHDFHLGIQWFERPPGIFVEAAYLVFISTTIVALH
jgi:hypothetical protein